jgi:hypothetical protein
MRAVLKQNTTVEEPAGRGRAPTPMNGSALATTTTVITPSQNRGLVSRVMRYGHCAKNQNHRNHHTNNQVT